MSIGYRCYRSSEGKLNSKNILNVFLIDSKYPLTFLVSLRLWGLYSDLLHGSLASKSRPGTRQGATYLLDPWALQKQGSNLIHPQPTVFFGITLNPSKVSRILRRKLYNWFVDLLDQTFTSRPLHLPATGRAEYGHVPRQPHTGRRIL